MADLPLEGRIVEKTEAKTIPLSLQEQVDLLRKDVIELSRGINTHAHLLESIITANDLVIKTYLEITRTPAERGVQSEPTETK